MKALSEYTPFQLMQAAKNNYSNCKYLSFHDRIVSVYRPLYTPLHHILRWIPAGSRLVDIGCGTGALLLITQALKGLGPSYGFDIDARSISIANSANRFRHINFASEKIVPSAVIQAADVISMIDVLHHVRRQEKQHLLTHVLSNIKKNGIVIIKDLGPRPYWQAMANRFTDFISTRSKAHYISAGEIEDIMRQYDFKIKVTQRLYKYVWSHYIIVGQKPAYHEIF